MENIKPTPRSRKCMGTIYLKPSMTLVEAMAMAADLNMTIDSDGPQLYLVTPKGCSIMLKTEQPKTLEEGYATEAYHRAVGADDRMGDK